MAETNAALTCYRERRISSASAMVFMCDSNRAADLAHENELDIGLHLNFSELFSGKNASARLTEYHHQIVRFISGSKYAQLLYNPFLRKAFAYCYHAQLEEFERLYGKEPSHIDGHHHMHLCGNILLSQLIPAGTRMRRNFSFWRGEKSSLNRAYRALVDRWLARRYRLPDYFFDLTQCLQQNKLARVEALAMSHTVELMTHPIVQTETDYLMSDEFGDLLHRLDRSGVRHQSSVA